MGSLKKVVAGLVLSGIALAASAHTGSTANATPIGYWKTIDDSTGKPKSIVQIWRADNQALMGKVVKVFPNEGGKQDRICSECKGEMHNQPIIGMVIMGSDEASFVSLIKLSARSPGTRLVCRLREKPGRLSKYQSASIL